MSGAYTTTIEGRVWKFRWSCFGTIGFITMLFVGTAEAQSNSRVELAGGYQLLLPICPGVSCYNYPTGWQGSVATRVTDWLSVVGEIGESLKTVSTSMSSSVPLTSTTSGTLTIRSETRLAFYDALAGPRATMRIERTRVFGELLVGLVHSTFSELSSFSIPEEHAATGTASSFDATHWAWQPSAGIDVPVSARWSVRFRIGYRVLGIADSSSVVLESGIAFRVRR
jgi:hypothetical protein